MWAVYVKAEDENHYAYDDERATWADAMRHAIYLMSNDVVAGVMIEKSEPHKKFSAADVKSAYQNKIRG